VGVAVVEVLAVLVLVGDGLVGVPVAVGAGGHRIVAVQVVAVVVGVQVLVTDRLMAVAMAVMLGGV
jgi:hypothetical protein